jgi:transposase
MSDLANGKRRTIYGFIGKLPASRLPYVEFTWSQTQETLVESNTRIVEFFGGGTEYLTIDYVSRHKIDVMLQLSLCCVTGEFPVFSRREKGFWQHNTDT